MRRAIATCRLAGQVAARLGPASLAARAVAAASTALAIAALAIAVPAHAQPAPPSPPAGALPEVVGGALRVGLNESVRLAIRNNLDVELVSVDPQIAQTNLGSAWGAYDPAIFGEGGYSDVETPLASQLFVSPTAPNRRIFLNQRIWDGEAGLQGLIPWLGGAYAVSYGGSELETNSPIETLSPNYGSSFLANVQIPLLRGLFWSEPWTAVRLARIGVDASVEQFRTDLMDIVRNTEDAYWLLIAAREERRVAQKSLETARALLEQTEAQFEVGVVSKVEVVQSEAGVADREFNLITLDARERTARDNFIDVVLGPYLAPDSELAIELADPPEEVPVREVDPEAATERAFANRPEVALARKLIEQSEVQMRFASNQRLPQLDVQGSYGNTGLAGELNERCGLFGPCIVPPVVEGDGWPDADREFFTGEAAESFTVRGILTIPIGNVRARNDYERARLELRRSRLQLQRLEQSIVSDIRRSSRNLLAALQGIEAAERGVAAAEEQLRAERVRLEYGESTPFDVLQREEDLVTAENQRIVAQRAYHNAITELERAQGTILERNAIVIDDRGALR
jgi:outer membrane protein TolC